MLHSDPVNNNIGAVEDGTTGTAAAPGGVAVDDENKVNDNGPHQGVMRREPQCASDDDLGGLHSRTRWASPSTTTASAGGAGPSADQPHESANDMAPTVACNVWQQHDLNYFWVSVLCLGSLLALMVITNREPAGQWTWREKSAEPIDLSDWHHLEHPAEDHYGPPKSRGRPHAGYWPFHTKKGFTVKAIDGSAQQEQRHRRRLGVKYGARLQRHERVFTARRPGAIQA